MVMATALVGTVYLVNRVLAQDYPPCETMGRQPGTNGASWQQGATITVIINPTDGGGGGGAVGGDTSHR